MAPPVDAVTLSLNTHACTVRFPPMLRTADCAVDPAFWIVSPDRVTLTPDSITNTPYCPAPSMARLPAPGPRIVRLSVMVGNPDETSVIGLHVTLNSIVSEPGLVFASEIAWRRLP